jgi:hypothetical protein
MKNILYILFACAIVWLTSCKETVVNPEILSVIPVISPDYTGITIPATIAPLNFAAVETNNFQSLHLKAEGSKGGFLEVQSTGFIAFPEKKWKQLLAENTGDTIHLTLSVKSEGRWKQYAPFWMYVSPHPIDYGLAYRLIAPGYEVYSKMGIYQRKLSNFEQSPVIENTIIPGACINCHSFNQTQAQKMSLHVRGPNGGTVIQIHENLKILNTKTDERVPEHSAAEMGLRQPDEAALGDAAGVVLGQH